MRIGGYEITAKKAIIALAGFIVLFNIYALAWYPPSPYIYRGTFMLVFAVITPLLCPPKTRVGKILIVLCTLLTVIGIAYPMVFEAKLTAQNFTASQAEVIVFFIFLVGIAGLLTRVTAGNIITGLVIVGLLYFIFGNYIPGFFGHARWPLTYITTHSYTDLDLGAFGSFTEQAVRLIAIYMVYAAFLMQSGLGDVFNVSAQYFAGKATGGPAKVTIWTSALFGIISGSSIANVAATGSFSIPLMKKAGYEPKMAATVESLASPGGNLSPPIMGVAAFLMADILGVSYLTVCLAAIIPTVIWYFTVYWSVHFYALGREIKNVTIPKSELMAVLKAKSHLLISLLVLIGTMAYTGGAEQAGLFGVISLLLLTFIKKETRLNWKKIADLLYSYAEMFAPLFIFMVSLGLLIAAMMASGVQIKIGQTLMGGITQWYVLLLITFFLVMVLGMVVPAAAAYIAAAVVVAPILAQFGTPPLVIHMFVFYVSVLAPITPPSAPAVFAAARIAGSDMMGTSIYVLLKSIPLWIVPFSMYQHHLLFGIGTPWQTLVTELAILAIGIMVFIMGVEGFSNHRLKMWERIVLAVVGIVICQPVSPILSKILAVPGIIFLIYIFITNALAKRAKAETIVVT